MSSIPPPPLEPPPVPPPAEPASVVVEPSERGESPWAAFFSNISSGWLSSATLHALLLLGLALIVPLAETRPGVTVLQSQIVDTADRVQEAHGQFEQTALSMAGDAAAEVLDRLADSDHFEPSLEEDRVPSLQPRGTADLPVEALLLTAGAPARGGFDGRTPANRARLALERGGSRQSEAAVELGLAWLAAHQRPDGSWRFSHKNSFCDGQCRNPGTHASTTGATAVALLPFLGAGYTHNRGQYQRVVRPGLTYLKQRMRTTPYGGDLQEGTMYAQGLATIALCEAYGMTQDPTLKEPALRAVEFVLYAQDTRGGGWRYTPGQPGDTTVTGWQLMALKSAQMAYLPVPRRAWYDAGRFLDGVQAGGGAYYGYQVPAKRDTTTAIGLLCRMYLGWDHDHPALARGAKHLAYQGPSKDNMYFNYYAAQVLLHYGGEFWEKWNEQMREYLIERQGTQGHESGSWYFSGGHCEEGGRLFSTALAVMTLEVYYRYMPLYSRSAVDEF